MSEEPYILSNRNNWGTVYMGTSLVLDLVVLSPTWSESTGSLYNHLSL